MAQKYSAQHNLGSKLMRDYKSIGPTYIIVIAGLALIGYYSNKVFSDNNTFRFKRSDENVMFHWIPSSSQNFLFMTKYFPGIFQVKKQHELDLEVNTRVGFKDINYQGNVKHD